jgi:Ca2+-binding EF-hand superfamily protein
MRTTLSLGVLTLLGGLAALADRPAPPAPPRPVVGDEQDLLVLHDARPWRIRLHLQIEGRTFRAGWEAAAGHLFRYLDVNGDGVLSAAEAARAPSAEQWRQLLSGEALLEPDAPPEFKDLQEGGKATPAALAAFYRRVQVGPLQVEWGPRTTPPDPYSPVLFGLLDTDKDGKLSRAELEAAPALLTTLDTEDVDIIKKNELLRLPQRSRTPNPPPAAADLPFTVLDPADPARTLTDRLLRTYDRDGNHRLGRKEIAFPKDLFDALDTNRDGELDEGELARWRERPADLEVLVPLGGSEASFVLLGGAEGRPPVLTACVLPGGTLHVALPAMRLELVALEVVNGGAKRVRETLLEQFRKAQTKGVLKARQLHQPPFTFVGLSRLADRNGDGDLSAQEMADYLSLQEKVVAASTFATIVNRGRNLFEFLDADRDGRLSRRELRTAWQRLAPWDHDGDGFLTRDELPAQYLLTLGHGRAPFTASGGPEMALSFRPPARPQGPLWFRKMDRNGDGDLSPREFLGTAEQFRRLDADGDGLISVEEAERADRDLRPPHP